MVISQVSVRIMIRGTYLFFSAANQEVNNFFASAASSSISLMGLG